MQTITLPETSKRPELRVFVDDDIALRLAGLPVTAHWDKGTLGWYVNVRLGPGHALALARWIMDAPAGYDVDHKNGDTLDNQGENLRVATRQQNLQNRRGWSSTGFKGVRHRRARPEKHMKECWEAWIGVDGRHVYVGRADSPEGAARLYDDAAKERFGEFARLNFPEKRRRTVQTRAGDC